MTRRANTARPAAARRRLNVIAAGSDDQALVDVCTMMLRWAREDRAADQAGPAAV